MTDEDRLLFDRIRAVLSHTAHYPETSVSLDTDIARDVGIWGDDAYHFMEAFMAEFGVDMTGFRFADYFEGEGMARSLFLSLLGMQPKRRALSVAMLLGAARRKRWGDGVA
jgi:hypothetical protein